MAAPWGDERDRVADVVVVGSGVAGYAAAIAAADAGASVVLLEREAARGGTTAKSGGAMWIPDDPFMRAAGLADDRKTALRYLARLAHPTRCGVVFCSGGFLHTPDLTYAYLRGPVLGGAAARAAPATSSSPRTPGTNSPPRWRPGWWRWARSPGGFTLDPGFAAGLASTWGPGGTVGPALTFGYLAGRTAAAEALRRPDPPSPPVAGTRGDDVAPVHRQGLEDPSEQ